MEKYSFKNIAHSIIEFLSLYLGALKYKKYSFVLSGFYYCPTAKNINLLVRLASTRKTFSVPMHDLVQSAYLLKKFHPINTFHLGMLLNMEKNSFIELDKCSGIENLSEMQNKFDNSKIPVALELLSIAPGAKKITLKPKMVDYQFTVSPEEILKNEFIIASLESLEAFHLGYNIFDLLQPELNRKISS